MDEEAKKTLFRGSARLVMSAPERFDDETRGFRARSNAWVVARPATESSTRKARKPRRDGVF